MSRAPARAGGGGTSKDGDICPVCKSSRYLNPNMRFLVNPECYHKMCESCVDRIFSHGPAPCPIAGCKRTLRKAKFRSQTFEDLKVEREVDIRRRVARVFNKTEEDFETLRAFNDYLEQIEEATWNLILKIDVEATEKKLRLYEEAQKAERLERNPNNATTTIRTTYQPPDPSLPSDTAQVVLKKGAAQRKIGTPSNAKGARSSDATAGSDGVAAETGFTFHGLKKYIPPPPEKPIDPFDGWSIVPQYYSLQNDYDVDWLTKSKEDPLHLVGGYDIREFYDRALCDAFSGFGVFIEEEIEAREKRVSGLASVGTQNAVQAAVGGKDVNMDDIF